MAAFVAYQLRLQKSGSPLMDLRTLKSRTFTITLLLMSAAFMAFLGTMILLPLYLQDLRGLSAMQTGALVMPGGIAMGLLGPRVGHLYDKFGSRPLVIPGSIVMVAALGALSRVDADTPFWLILGHARRADGEPRDDLHAGVHARTGRPDRRSCTRTAARSWARCSRSPARSARPCSS